MPSNTNQIPRNDRRTKISLCVKDDLTIPGEVYKAKDTRLDRTVAIKVLPSELAQDPGRRERFEREARAVASLNHPHICTLYDIGRENGIDFLVMEHIEGETLADVLRKGALPLDRALRAGIQLADALDKAHRQGVVHRDVKPGNIMLSSGVKPLDFGLARSRPKAELAADSESPTKHKPLTEEGALLGTVPYMAPEQLEGKEAGEARRGPTMMMMTLKRRSAWGKVIGSAALWAVACALDYPAPPETPRGDVVDTIHTEAIPDPHRWLEAQDVPATRAWIDRQNA